MASVLGVTALWLVFGGTHVGFVTRRLREGLVSRLGERGFLALFSLIAAVSFSVLVHYYTLHRFDGPPGLALGEVPALRWTLMAVVVAGGVLIAPSLVVYPRSPMALFNQAVAAPPAHPRAPRPVRRRPRRSDGSSARHAWAGWLGLFFIATALGHALVGVAVFHEALAAIARDGFVNAVHPQVLERGVVPYFDREAAFWFILYTPILVLIGLVTRRALEVRDVVLLRFVGWTLLATGGVGAVAMPISGFWIV